MASFYSEVIKGTKLQVTASVKGEGSIVLPTFHKAITLPQARKLSDALLHCAMFLENHFNKRGSRGQDTGWVTIPDEFSDKQLERYKFLFVGDNEICVVARRAALFFGKFTQPVVTLEEWDFELVDDGVAPINLTPPRHIAIGSTAARQASHSIAMMVGRCQTWLPLD